jgi:hypothetical protein
MTQNKKKSGGVEGWSILAVLLCTRSKSLFLSLLPPRNVAAGCGKGLRRDARCRTDDC